MGKESNVKDIYPLAPLQQGFLFHWLSDNESSMYNEQFEYTITGQLDINLMEKSLNKLIERYDLLRTIFMVERVKEPLQVVLKERKLSVYFEDISHLAGKKEKYSYIETFRKKDRARGFDLSKDLLFKFFIFKTRESEYKLIWSFHHIMMDAWSHEILYGELIQIYSSLREGKPLELEPVIPYKNYIQWLEKQDKEKGLKYWQEYLYGYDSPVVIPGTHPKQRDKRAELVKYRCHLQQGVSNGLLKLAGESRTTIYTVLQAIWGILLQKYCNVDDVVYGAVVSGRPPKLKGVETMIGLFINTIPVRINTGEECTFSQLLQKVRDKEILSKSYEYLPLAEVQSCSPLKRDLINHILVFESRPVNLTGKKNNRADTHSDKNTETKDNPGSRPIDFTLVNMGSYQQINYNFSLVIHPGNPLKIGLYFDPSTYEIDFIKNIAGHLKELIRQVVANPGIKLKDLEIITAEEKKRLLFDFNKTDTQYPKDKTIHQLLEEQVEKTPDKTAAVGTKQLAVGKKEVVSESIQLTFKELNEKSNQLTHLLLEKGVSCDTIVGIMVERSIEMIIGILGILKAGGAYLPIDPDLPQKRIDYILKDSQAKILVTSPVLLEKFEKLLIVNCQLLMINEILPNRRSLNNPPKEANSISNYQLKINNLQLKQANLAYIIYTSGTTGKPKGVAIDHANVMPLLQWGLETLGIGYDDRILQTLSYFFDWSVWEIFITFGSGAVLVIVPSDILTDSEAQVDAIGKHCITILHVTPTQYRYLDGASQDPNTLNYLFIGAEVLPLDLVKRSIERTNPNCRIFNMYGPTEASIISAVLEIDRDNPDVYGHLPAAPIGQPVGNTMVFITDRYFNLCPIGVVGELYIAGDGLARGYLNRPQLTAEKFDHELYRIRLFDAFAAGTVHLKKPSIGPMGFIGPLCHGTPGRRRQKIYRTGDLARWLPDGNIEFLGRIDQQVKIRGFRIELEEIESQLLTHEDINEAVVIAKEGQNGSNELQAFIVGSKDLELSQLKAYLAKRLPDYMLPANISRIDQIPVNHNGKVDKKALFEKSKNLRSSTQHIAPQNQIQQQMAGVWQEVLKISQEEIGIYDNFFDLGGDSIKIMQLRSRLNQQFNKNIQITLLFEYPTIHSLAQFLKQEEAEQEIDRSDKINEGKVRLQQRMNQKLRN